VLIIADGNEAVCNAHECGQNLRLWHPPTLTYSARAGRGSREPTDFNM
jgi:hypothetical protein